MFISVNIFMHICMCVYICEIKDKISINCCYSEFCTWTTIRQSIYLHFYLKSVTVL